MKISFTKKLLKVYLWFNYIAIPINLVILFFVLLSAFFVYGLIGDQIHSPFDLSYFHNVFMPAVLSAILYFVLTIYSANAVQKITQDKILNNLEKIFLILFPAITVPLYAFIIYKGFLH